MWVGFGVCPDLSFWIIRYRKIVDPAKREDLVLGTWNLELKACVLELLEE